MTIYEALFGTPERAAKALMMADINTNDYCCMMFALSDDEDIRCKNCPYEYRVTHRCEPRDMTYLDWLKQEVAE